MIHTRKREYLAYSFDLNPAERSLIEKFAGWLPDMVVDSHAHSNLPEHAKWMEGKTYHHMLSTFPSFTIDESESLKRVLFPGRTVCTLRFAKTFRGIDHRAANQYLLDCSGHVDRVALFGLPEDVAYTTSMLHHPRVSALKMYYSYVEPTATTIYEYFKPEILEVAEALRIPIVLHTPKILTMCREDLRRVVTDFPNLRISIAHLGLLKVPIPDLEETFKEVAGYKNLVMDTALNPSSEVAEMAIRILGEDRVMYGSDEPLNLIRSRVFVHPEKGQRLITEYPYHWVDTEDHSQYGHLAQGVVHAHWLSMNALFDAIESFPRSERERVKEKVFFRNAAAFFGFQT